MSRDRVREEEYTLDKCIEIFDRLYKFLEENEDILFDSELRHKAQKAGICKSHTLRYLQYEKYIKELEPYKKNMKEIMEYRIAKTKEMYHVITAMSLKNKHKWVDKQEVDNTHKFDQIEITMTVKDREEIGNKHGISIWCNRL